MFFLRMLIGASLISLLLWKIEPRALLDVIAEVHVDLLLVAGVALAFDRLLMAYKWNLLLRSKGIRISTLMALRIYLVGNLIGLVTPGAIGLEIYRVAALSSFGRTHDIAATALLERLVGLAMLIFFLLAALPFASSLLPLGDGTIRWLAIGSIAGLAVIVVSFLPRVNLWILSAVPVTALGGFGRWLLQLVHSYNKAVADFTTLAWFSGWTFIEVLISIAVIYFAAASLGVQASITAFAVIVPTALLLSRLPLSLDGIGVAETVYVLAFNALGYSSEHGLALALLVRLIRLVVAQLPAAFLLMRYGAAPNLDVDQHTKQT